MHRQSQHDPSSGPDPDRVSRLRERVRAGVYDSPDVADEVARRLIASGDLLRSPEPKPRGRRWAGV